MLHGKTLHVDENSSAVTALKALASVPRWRILQLLANGGRSITEVAEALRLPASTAAAHVKILEEAGFLQTELQAATHGLQKVCSRTYDNVVVQLPFMSPAGTTSVEVVMPVGGYTTFDVSPTCGLASAASLIGFLDDPVSFYEPERLMAGLIWFRSGYVEYTFPNRLPKSATPRNLQISMEICSEAPLHNHNWPSDVTLWINDCELGAWICPSDFGGQHGVLTPSWWDNKDSQYGLLKRWTVNNDGAFIDGRQLSGITIAELELERAPVITVRLGVKTDALHVGGLNLFGHTFGNYAQDLLLRLEYVPGKRNESEP